MGDKIEHYCYCPVLRSWASPFLGPSLAPASLSSFLLLAPCLSAAALHAGALLLFVCYTARNICTFSSLSSFSGVDFSDLFSSIAKNVAVGNKTLGPIVLKGLGTCCTTGRSIVPYSRSDSVDTPALAHTPLA